MALPADVARGRNIVARWCNLAEQRLEHLTELFESGRWRRYHTEREFLENIQEAKAAVETWRDLLNREASLESTAIDMSWVGRRRTTALPRDVGYRQPVVHLKPQPAPIAVTPPPIVAAPLRDIPADILVALESRLAVADEAPSVPDAPALDEMALPPLDLDTMKERYPLLRNTL
ncbi:TIGR03809 family protein [Bradyrhizobium sp. AUGA SZCCT0283]|uniref:TIGR03809 family protein n=1 Tax=Bradyrhizobium sp. AUGA SZCCT0283 TaxID=2807671 RepID=UPI001BA6FC5E|nr:TIGR03809 family protein [Bradyrhizobium sp. AUGA SZCCT0283]MBR1274654.1 TIGR03809 family protein [Bradyrhizobium sp. AUGA SZCCT0283]